MTMIMLMRMALNLLCAFMLWNTGQVMLLPSVTIFDKPVNGFDEHSLNSIQVRLS